MNVSETVKRLDEMSERVAVLENEVQAREIKLRDDREAFVKAKATARLTAQKEPKKPAALETAEADLRDIAETAPVARRAFEHEASIAREQGLKTFTELHDNHRDELRAEKAKAVAHIVAGLQALALVIGEREAVETLDYMNSGHAAQIYESFVAGIDTVNAKAGKAARLGQLKDSLERLKTADPAGVAFELKNLSEI